MCSSTILSSLIQIQQMIHLYSGWRDVLDSSLFFFHRLQLWIWFEMTYRVNNQLLEKLRAVVLLSRTHLRRDMFAAIGVLSSVQPQFNHARLKQDQAQLCTEAGIVAPLPQLFLMPLRTFCFRLLYRWCTKPGRMIYGIECHHIVKMLLIMLRIVKTSLFKVLDKVINYDSFEKMVVYCYAAIRYSKHTFCKNF